MTGFAGTAGHSKKSAHALEQERPDVLKRRRAWFDGQLDLDPAKLVFIDETGLSTKMARLRGRATRGERCRAGVPHGHWKTTTFTGALRLTGMTAPFVYDGAMNGNVFRAYVEQVLVPTLAPGDMPSPSSRHSCGQRPSAPSPPSGTPSAHSSKLFTPAECANYFKAAGYEPE